jgi:hypothetical protein
MAGSNRRRAVLQTAALPTELIHRKAIKGLIHRKQFERTLKEAPAVETAGRISLTLKP